MAKVRARTSALVSLDGSPFGVREGVEYDDKDPVVRAYPDLFERGVPVEEATANPGQRRNVRRDS